MFRRLLAIELLAVTAVWVGLAITSFYQTYDKETGVIDQELRLVSNAVARLTNLNPDVEYMRSVVEQLKAIIIESAAPFKIEAKDIAFQIWDHDGHLILAVPANNTMPNTMPVLTSKPEKIQYADWHTMAGQSPDGKLLTVVGYSNYYYAQMKRLIIEQIVSTYLASIFIATIALWLAVRFGLRPMRDLALQVSAKKHDDFSPMTPSREYLEMRPMVSALNDKMQRIGNMIETERIFFADAAHELRTPLAVLSAQAHVVAIEKDAGLRAEALAELEAGVQRSARVLNKLLTMAKYQGAETRAALANTDLVPLVSDIVAEHAPRAIEAELELSLDAPRVANCLCDAVAIRIAIENLVDNAIRYSPQGGQILVLVQEKPAGTSIIVADEGPGIVAADRIKIFERFERLDTCATTGSGLGLAIVKRIVELHKGTIAVLDGFNHSGTQFEMILPRK